MPRKKTRSVSYQYFIRALPKRVFEAITDPKWIVRWLADTAQISAHKGGRYLIGWIDGPQHSGTTLDFVPGKSMTLSWEWEGVAVHGTRFKLSVEAKGSGVLFKVGHSDFPNQNKWADLYGGAELWLLNLPLSGNASSTFGR